LLGNRTNLSEAQALGQATNAAKAAAFRDKVIPAIQLPQAQGMTFDQIAATLTARRIGTYNGGACHKSTVSRLLKAGA
jgi:hypothetical protein